MTRTLVLNLLSGIGGLLFLVYLKFIGGIWLYSLGFVSVLASMLNVLTSSGWLISIFRLGNEKARSQIHKNLVSILVYRLSASFLVLYLVDFLYDISSIEIGFMLASVILDTMTYGAKCYDKFNMIIVVQFVFTNLARLLVLLMIINSIENYILWLIVSHLITSAYIFYSVKPKLAIRKPNWDLTYLQDVYGNYIVRELDQLILLLGSDPGVFANYFVIKKIYGAFRLSVGTWLERLGFHSRSIKEKILKLYKVHNLYLVFLALLVVFGFTALLKDELLVLGFHSFDIIGLTLAIVSFIIQRPIYNLISFGTSRDDYSKNIRFYVIVSISCSFFLYCANPAAMILSVVLSNIFSASYSYKLLYT